MTKFERTSGAWKLLSSSHSTSLNLFVSKMMLALVMSRIQLFTINLSKSNRGDGIRGLEDKVKEQRDTKDNDMLTALNEYGNMPR